MTHFWKLMYALALAQAMDAAPFHLNPHRLPYTHYKCVWCRSPAGTRAPCDCRKSKR